MHTPGSNPGVCIPAPARAYLAFNRASARVSRALRRLAVFAWIAPPFAALSISDMAFGSALCADAASLASIAARTRFIADLRAERLDLFARRLASFWRMRFLALS